MVLRRAPRRRRQAGRGFSTKNFTDIAKPLPPTTRIDLDLPDGTSHHKIGKFAPEDFSASDERCDVRVGGNVFSGDLHSYQIVAEVEDVAVEISLVGDVPAWRPATGHRYYGAPRGWRVGRDLRCGVPRPQLGSTRR